MEIHKTIIGLAIATVIVMGTLVPFISSAVVSYDQDGSVLSFGSYDSDELDGWSLSASVTGSAVHVTSTMWKGSVDGSTYLLASDSGNIWYDGSIHSLMGNVYRTYASLEASIENGTLKIGSDSYAISTVYVPSSKGTFGSHNNGSVNDPIMGVGSFAGITLGANGTSVISNTSGYAMQRVVSTIDGRETIEFVASAYEPPVQVPPRQQENIKPGLDLDVFEDLEQDIFEKGDIGEFEKGEITIIPGKGEMGSIDMDTDVIVPGKLPANDIQAVGDATSGTTGQCTWELDGTTLYIRGDGTTDNYSTTVDPPWGRSITKAIIEEGVRQLGSYLFYNSVDLIEVELPPGLNWISSHCFHGCSSLRALDLPDGLTMLNYNATQNCSSLKELICPDSVTTFGAVNVSGCTSLVRLYIPPTATTISTQGVGTHFVDFDGTDRTTFPLDGGLWIKESDGTYYKSVETPTHILNWYGATVTATDNTAEVRIPYLTEYDGQTYTVKTIADGAISGSSVRNVIIPQTVESVSPTAITAINVQQILNLSEADVSAQGDVRTSVPATVTLSEMPAVYSPYRDVIQMVPLLLILGFVIAAVGSIGSRRL